VIIADIESLVDGKKTAMREILATNGDRTTFVRIESEIRELRDDVW
jgi:hypothetical protein